MVINQCNKIHINPKTESILKVQKQVVKLVHYIKDQTVEMIGEKVHYLKKKQAGSRRVPDKIQTVDHNSAGRDDQNKNNAQGMIGQKPQT